MVGRTLIRQEVLRVWRRRTTWLALVLMAAIHGTGWVAATGDDRLFGYGYLTCLALGVRPGVHSDLRCGRVHLLAYGLHSPMAYVSAKTLVGMAWPLALGGWGFGLAVAFSGGDVEFGAWHAALLTSAGVICIAPAMLVEVTLGARFPVPVVYLGAVLSGMALVGAGVEAESVLAGAGFRVTPGAWASLAPAALRAGVATLLTWGGLWVTVSRERRRTGFVSASLRPPRGR
jgi:hypothetical protein